MKPPLKPIKPLHLSQEGKLDIPQELLQYLNLKPGELIVAYVEGDRLILRPRKLVEAELWTMFRDREDISSDRLIQERRQEVLRESE